MVAPMGGSAETKSGDDAITLRGVIIFGLVASVILALITGGVLTEAKPQARSAESWKQTQEAAGWFFMLAGAVPTITAAGGCVWLTAKAISAIPLLIQACKLSVYRAMLIKDSGLLSPRQLFIEEIQQLIRANEATASLSDDGVVVAYGKQRLQLKTKSRVLVSDTDQKVALTTAEFEYLMAAAEATRLRAFWAEPVC